MVDHIVITEGLVTEENTPEDNFLLSDYFEAVLQRIIQEVPTNEPIYIYPGNAFGCECSEEEYKAITLHQKNLK
ncbi:MAG: hypothetical protein WBB43_15510 [Limnoraphis sp.]